MLIEAIKPENFPELILCNFLTRVCESSTHDLCVLPQPRSQGRLSTSRSRERTLGTRLVLPLQKCKLKCDWFLSTDVTEIVLVVEFADIREL